MATITKNKGNGRNKVMLSDQELKTVTIALALINHIDMEQEMEEQGLAKDDVEYNHLELFKPFAKVTNLYPQKTLEDVDGESNFLLKKAEVNSELEEFVKKWNALDSAPLAMNLQESLVDISNDKITLKAENITIDENGYTIATGVKSNG